MFKRKTLQVGSFEVNCFLLINNDKALIIDPGQDAPEIIAELEKSKATPQAILLTHGHFDHINAIPDLQKKWPDLPVCVSAADAQVMQHPFNSFAPEYVAVKGFAQSSPDRFASEWNYQVIETPGHTPGGVCYYFPEAKEVYTGDTLFAGSVGRTDFPGGDMATLMASLEKLKALPPSVTIFPGHGGTSTIERELATNPFLQ